LTLTHSDYQVDFEPQALKQLGRTDPQAQRSILAAAKLLASNPHPPKSKKLSGHDRLWRVRVGDYRIVYTVKDSVLTVLVVQVGHRRDVYRL
jgi:mRNA interferase RelE/StbE